MQTAAVLAGALRFVAVKGREERRQILDDVGDFRFHPMDQRAAVEAEPLEAVEVLLAPRSLDHQSDRTLDRALRRMAHVRRQEEDLAFTDRHVEDPAALGNLQQHVALDLIEEFLHRVVVEVDPLVRAADDHDHHLGLGVEELLVADRRLQQMLVFRDPGLEIEGLEARVPDHASLHLMTR